MSKPNLLIVEDNVDESNYALLEALHAGMGDKSVARTLEEAFDLIEFEKPDFIAIDLFFPAGNVDTKGYVERLIPYYEKFEEQRFPRISADNVVMKAIEQVAGVFGATPRRYVEEVMPALNTAPKLLEAARDAVYGRKDSERHVKFLGIKKAVADGTNAPYGVFVVEEARRRNIPCVVVTSTYHHDDAFEAIRSLITVPYYDTLVDGRKNWRAGIERLKGLEGGE
jgi:hypothetical protein